MTADGSPAPAGSSPSLAQLFSRFLVLGLRAWGGPVVQIPALRDEFAGDRGWVSRQRFDRALALYQALPGPEATEMCVWLGMQVRGRIGGLLAGVGFILPGLVLVVIAASAYGHLSGIQGAAVAGALLGMQAAVAAMIVRAVERLSARVLTSVWACAIALAAALSQAAGVPFWVALLTGGGVGALGAAGRRAARALAGAAVCGLVILAAWSWSAADHRQFVGAQPVPVVQRGTVDPGSLLVSGLRGGSLTFGGAFTLVPVLHDDAVVRHPEPAWVSETEFLDAIAITGVLPTPMVTFGTFIAMLAGGWIGAAAMTFGLFLPAFAITLLAHAPMERLIERKGLHAALDGVTAAVVGVMAAVGARIVIGAVDTTVGLLIFAACAGALYTWKTRWATPACVLMAGVTGAVLARA
jgi:chromate transporter